MEDFEKLQYEDELKANQFSSVFLSVLCGACLLVWGANELGIFVVNRVFMRIGMILASICMLVPLITYIVTLGQNRYFKYVLLISVSLTVISIQTFLTFHGTLMCVVPILLSAQYADSRVFHLAFWLNLFGILFSVLLGYYIGCWDGNMIYATTYGITLELDSLAARAAIMNTDYMIQLLLYFAFPRMVIFSVLALSLSYILKIAKLQYVRQNTIRIQAEQDGLTRLENRAKFNYRSAHEYGKLRSVYVAFIDVNFLKKMNDLCGHEAGDSVIIRVADEMRRLISDTVHGYRLGGDEFALIFCNYSESNARRMLREWEKEIPPLNRKEAPVHCSLAIGGAYADHPIDIEKVVKEADDDMYTVKLAMKAQRTD